MAQYGYLAFVLHGHIPYVLGHGTWPHGEEWLYEAAAETYLPLLELAARLRDAGLRGEDAALTCGITPVLAEMLDDPRFDAGFRGFLAARREAAEEDVAAFSADAAKKEFVPQAERWARHYAELLRVYEEEHAPSILGSFRRRREEGALEILGGPATHCYGPLMKSEEGLDLQYDTGRRTFQRCFGSATDGAWMPECAYRPAGLLIDALGRIRGRRAGMEALLARHGIHYSFVDSQIIRGGVLAWSYGTHFRQRTLEGRITLPPDEQDAALYRPHWVGDGSSRLAVFARDPRTGVQVWSGVVGYPASGVYLEFHKRHDPGGHRYWAVTDAKAELHHKVPYRPEWIAARIEEQARHFVRLVEDIVRHHPGSEPPLVCAPYDAELFGHWWFEGPRWLLRTLELLHASPIVKPITPGVYLRRHPPSDRMLFSEGSWGDRGDHRTWLGRHADRFWTLVYEGEESLAPLLREPARDATEARVRRQAARTLLLLQASDWPFLLYAGTAADYAAARIEGHAADLELLVKLLTELHARPGPPSDALMARLEELETRDAVFPDLQPELLVRRI